ncbi:hypothetical protein INS49_011931 [Diaporthe citri]|uniref:uncharacterized protein n=1 Tax=Diaporthe citri TaxID=83186 RepID=UPI001C80B81E|nr:uncharacterized protein INS49_011931 [Diaporthe citri]KAG6360864.1 hypothetical protein INS49_011931 [Diaporthe citri]
MDDGAESGPHRRQRPPRSAIAALLGLLLLVNLSASLYQLPLNRVVEKRLCQEYYSQHDPSVIGPDGNIDEKLCKADPIQAGLGRIQGFMDTTWIVGDFVMTIPLGFVAERYGRRALLWLNLVPRVFMLAWAVIVGYFDQILPTKAIAAGPALSFLGGDCVFNSITYSLAAGITDDYVLRASYFGYMSSITYVVNLLGPALASASMTLLLWLPFWIGITLLAIAIPTISMLPDHNTAKDQRDEQSQPLLSSPLLKAQDSGPTVLRSVVDRFHALRAYISKRYRWTFASAGYLLSGKAVVNFVLLTIIVPRVLRSAVAGANGSSPGASGRINFRFAKLCFGVSVLGAAAIAVSATIWLLVPALLVYALGSALPIFTLSLLKSPAICSSSADDRLEGDREASLPGADAETPIFSIVMLVKTLGSLLGAPLMAFLWVRGIGLGGAALGMPYFVSAGCYAAAIFIFCRIRIQ